MKRKINNTLPACRVSAWVGMILALFFATSCIDENAQEADAGKSVTLTLLPEGMGQPDTRAYVSPGTGSDKDRTILDFRVMVFKKSTGVLVWNEYTADLTGKLPLTVKLPADNYDFVFIANEASDATSDATPIHTTLDAWHPNGHVLSELEALTFSSAAMDSTKHIPMSAIYQNVALASGGYTPPSGTSTAYSVPWSVSMVRLAVRVDVQLTANAAAEIKRTKFTGLEFRNVPKRIPVLARTTGATPQPIYNNTGGYEVRTVLLAEGGAWSTSGSDKIWKKNRIILPSSVFSSTTTPANGIQVVAKYTGMPDITQYLATTPYGSSTNYTVPRNQFYTMQGTINNDLTDVFISAAPWTTEAVHTAIGGQQLNVENTNILLINNTVRVYFWSNQPNDSVYVLPQGYEDASGTSPYTVNTVFSNLSGKMASNLHFTGNGAGYLDITKSTSFPPGDYVRRILLNAGGLQREITVDIRQVTLNDTQLLTNSCVGAFWRDKQTGERIIRIPVGSYSGAWTATVAWTDDRWANGVNDIVLSTDPSADTGITLAANETPADMNNPTNDALYNVSGNLTSVNGTVAVQDTITFRVGLKSNYTSSEQYPARYAWILVTYGGTSNRSFRIFLRQGESADYVFRPTDSAPSGTYTGPRTLAVRFSPYNLTDAALFDDATSPVWWNNTAIQGGKFVNYPSQAGAFWKWGTDLTRVSSTETAGMFLRRAYHPSAILYDTTPGINWDTDDTFTSSNDVWDEFTGLNSLETCPPGYRRPKVVNSNSAMSTTALASGSELMQSLFYITGDGNGTNGFSITHTDGYRFFGYYADGYFDRRQVVDSKDGTRNSIAVSAGTKDVAYKGVLFTNPVTNASLFAPCAGLRARLPQLIQDGYYFFWWTSSATSNSNAWYVSGTPTQGSSSGLLWQYNSGSRINAYSVRCVRE